MMTTDDLFRLRTAEEFEAAALEVFRRQAAECPPYREYLSLIGIEPMRITRADEIPALPIGLFKTRTVYCGDAAREAVFTSSATTGMTSSRHPMRSLALYEQAFRASFRTFYGDPRRWSLYALLPNYLRRKGSSLVYMADRLIAENPIGRELCSVGFGGAVRPRTARNDRDGDGRHERPSRGDSQGAIL